MADREPEYIPVTVFMAPHFYDLVAARAERDGRFIGSYIKDCIARSWGVEDEDRRQEVLDKRRPG